MRRGQRSGATHAREALTEHFTIKPRAADRVPPPNEANRCMRWDASDPRWRINPPYGWRRVVLAEWTWCAYCALIVRAGEKALYSYRLSCGAHLECHADGDPIDDG